MGRMSSAGYGLCSCMVQQLHCAVSSTGPPAYDYISIFARWRETYIYTHIYIYIHIYTYIYICINIHMYKYALMYPGDQMCQMKVWY